MGPGHLLLAVFTATQILHRAATLLHPCQGCLFNTLADFSYVLGVIFPGHTVGPQVSLDSGLVIQAEIPSEH